MEAYDAIALVATSAANAATDSCSTGKFREARQLSVLLSALKHSITDPNPCLPASIAIFLAEAAVAVTNPSSFLFPIINQHLLQSVTLPLRGLPLFHSMHYALSADWQLCRSWAHAAALAAPALHAPRQVLLPEASAAAAEIAATCQVLALQGTSGKKARDACGDAQVSIASAVAAIRVYIESVTRAASAAAVAPRMVEHGEVAALSGIVDTLLGAVDVARAADARAQSCWMSGIDSALREVLMVGAQAVKALERISAWRHIWQADIAAASLQHFGCSLVALRPWIAQLATGATAVRDAFWKLLGTILQNARAWDEARAALLGVHNVFWCSLCDAVRAPRQPPAITALLADCLLQTSATAMLADGGVAMNGDSGIWLGANVNTHPALEMAVSFVVQTASTSCCDRQATEALTMRLCSWLVSLALLHGARSPGAPCMCLTQCSYVGQQSRRRCGGPGTMLHGERKSLLQSPRVFLSKGACAAVQGCIETACVGSGWGMRPGELGVLLVASSMLGGYLTGPRAAELQDSLHTVTLTEAHNSCALKTVAEGLAEVAAGSANMAEVVGRMCGHSGTQQSNASAVLLELVVKQSTVHEAMDVHARKWGRMCDNMAEWLIHAAMCAA
jgi:hypothetical protein